MSREKDRQTDGRTQTETEKQLHTKTLTRTNKQYWIRARRREAKERLTHGQTDKRRRRRDIQTNEGTAFDGGKVGDLKKGSQEVRTLVGTEG